MSSQTAPGLSKEEYDKAKKYLEDTISKCNSQDQMDIFTWKYCRQKLDTDISVKVVAAKDKKGLKTFATKLILNRIETLKQKEQEAQEAVQELFASDDSDVDEDGPEDTGSKSKIGKAKKGHKTAKKGNSKASLDLSDDDSSSSSSDSDSSSGDESISSDSSDSSDSEESESEEDSDEDGPLEARQKKRFSKSAPQPKIATEIAQLLDAYCSKASLRATMKRIRCNKGRLGKITRPQIQAAYTLLRQLQDVVLGPEYEREEQIKNLSSNFFEKMNFDEGDWENPTTSTATATTSENRRLINSLELIQSYAKRLHIISAIEASHRIITGTKKKHENAVGVNYIDTKYRVLPCQISFVNSDSGQWKQIEQAVKSTQAIVHNDTSISLHKLYSIERSTEMSRFEPFKALPNRKLLWYPVPSKGALAGIMSLGLRAIPPDAPTTGLLFGKGVRLYDCVSRAVRDTEKYLYPTRTTSKADKSAAKDNGMDVDEDDEDLKEADPSSNNDHKVFLILCDVACGKIHEMRRSQYMEHAPPPYHSVKAIGQFNTTSNLAWTSTDMFSPELPLGPMHDTKEQFSTKLSFNEYIIYDKGQICMKYLVELNLAPNSQQTENMKSGNANTMMMEIDGSDEGPTTNMGATNNVSP